MLMRGSKLPGRRRGPDRQPRVSSSTSWAGLRSRVSSDAATISAISANRIRSSRNASTATSFAALKTHGAGAAALPRLRASASNGNASRSGAWNSSVRPSAGRGRHGRRRPLRVRERVRDGDAHVRVAEVRQRRAVAEAHDRVDDRRRVNDDLQPVVGRPNRKCASISSSPLFASVAESIGDLRAHVPGRMSERLARGYVRQVVCAICRGTGRPDAVSTSECDRLGAPRPSRH